MVHLKKQYWGHHSQNPGADVINEFLDSGAMLKLSTLIGCSKHALMTTFKQLKCLNSEQQSYAILKFVYEALSGEVKLKFLATT